MVEPVEPEWLRQLLDGSLTASIAPEHASPQTARGNGTVALAEVGCVAALAGMKLPELTRLTDPSAGNGLLVWVTAQALASAGTQVKVRAIEPDTDVDWVAGGVPHRLRLDFETEVANVITDDVLAPGSSDLVVSVPPWGVSWGHQAEEVRQRQLADWYPAGVGAKNDSGVLLLQRAISALRADESGGRLVTFLNEGMLWSRGGESLRRELIERDLLEAIARLPSGLAMHTEVPLHLVVLRTRKPRSLQGRVKLIDLRSYVTSGGRGRSRRISAEGLRLLWTALAHGRRGPNVRVVPHHDLLERSIRVTRRFGETTSSWTTVVPVQDTPRAVKRRYGPVPVEWDEAGAAQANFHTGRFFQSGLGVRGREPGGARTTRLSALLRETPTTDQQNYSSSVADTYVYLPTAKGDASTAPPGSSGRVIRLLIDTDLAHPEYLAGWFNSAVGRAAVVEALDTGATGGYMRLVRSDERSLWKFVDAIEVPLPSLGEQADIAQALLDLRRVEGAVADARSDLWSGSESAALVTGAFRGVLDDSLGRWSEDLPYPFATALWSLTSRTTIEAQHRQIFHTWEAYVAFLATVLLSTLEQDSDLAYEEGPALARALSAKHLSLERASFGTWCTVVQRLSSRLRKLLEESSESGDPDRVMRLLGGAPGPAAQAILSSECVGLLEDVNNKRNTWMGHGGAAAEDELRSQVDHLTASFERLRELVRGSWSLVPLVRAGRAAQRRDGIVQDVEYVMGTNVPFRPGQIRVGRMMMEGELYLATDGCDRPLPLSHLVVLRSTPTDQRNSCYFYNRVEDGQVRMVSYQMSHASDHYEPLESLEIDLPWLLAR